MQETNKDGSYSVSITEKWRKDWADAKIPVYLVYVHLEHKPPVKLIEHPAVSTMVHAHAYRVRANGVLVATVRVARTFCMLSYRHLRNSVLEDPRSDRLERRGLYVV